MALPPTSFHLLWYSPDEASVSVASPYNHFTHPPTPALPPYVCHPTPPQQNPEPSTSQRLLLSEQQQHTIILFPAIIVNEAPKCLQLLAAV